MLQDKYLYLIANYVRNVRRREKLHRNANNKCW